MKGFTLIEILAVIVVLAIIMVISVPLIGGVIEDVKKNSFKIAVKHLAKAAELTYFGNKENKGREIIFEFNDYEMTSNFPDATLEFEGKAPQNGNLIIRKDGKISYSFHDGKYCIEKGYDETEPVANDKNSDLCVSEVEMPVVAIVGANPQYIEINTNYSDLGATAITTTGEEISLIDVMYKEGDNQISSIDTSVKGTYRVIYTVLEDYKTNFAERTVIVRDTIKPILHVPTSTSITIAEVNEFNFLSDVTVSDNSLETLTVSVSGSISRIAGSYEIVYSATDSSGNTIEMSRIINVNDIEAPLLILNGSDVINLNFGDTYTELNATATDDADGDLTSSIVRTGSVNTNLVGTYFITYTSTDSSNNESSITRTVNVIDTVLPTVTFGTNGNSAYANNRNTTVSVTDNVSVLSRHYQWTNSTVAPTSLSFSQSFTSGDNIVTPTLLNGGYYLWIKAVDTNNNETIVRSNVFNLDNTAPVFTNITNSSNGVWTNANVTLGWTASDSLSGLSVMQFSYDQVTINPTSITQPSSNPTTWNSSAVWTTERDSYVYFRIIDAAGNASAWSAGTAVRIDKTAPNFTTLTPGYNAFPDTNFASGVNGMAVYNNNGNGLVVHSRIPMTTPTGSGYGLRITVNGAASPGLGGFYQWLVSQANGVYVHKIVARIPVGYSIQRASNPIGNEATVTWVTSQLGTGNWQEYIYVTRAGSTGSFSSLGHVYVEGTPATAGSPFVWDVAYTALTDSSAYGTSAAVAFSGADAASGINGYSYGTVSAPGTYTAVTAAPNIAKMNTGYTTNQNVYIWLRDAAGNQGSGLIPITKVDTTPPVVTFGTNGNHLYYKTHSTTVSVTDNFIVASRQYQWTTSTTAPSSASFTTTFINGETISTPPGGNYSYYLWVKAVDNTGNETITRSNAFNLDNGGPGITIVTNGGTAKPASTVVNCSDAINLFSSLVYAWTNSTTTPSSGWISFANGATLTQASMGTWYLHVRVTDTAGNVTTTRSNAFVLASLLSNSGTSYIRTLNAEGTVATAGATTSSSWTLARELTVTESGLFVVSASFWGYATSGYSIPEASFGVNGVLVGSVGRGARTSADAWDQYYLTNLSTVLNVGDRIQLWLRVDPSYANANGHALGRFKTVTTYYVAPYGGGDPYPYNRTLN